VPVGAIRAATDVDVDDTVLTRVQIVRDAEGWRELDRPVAWFERRVAVKEFKTELQSLVSRKLFRTSEELSAFRIDAAHTRRRWRTTLLDVG